MNLKNSTSTYVPAMISTGAIWVGLFLLAGVLTWENTNSLALIWIICLTGNVLGIPVGMLASPYESEGGHFQKIGGLIATFFSGFILSQFMEFKEKIESIDETQLAAMLLFISFFVLGAVQTFIFRRYSDETREKDVYLSNDQVIKENDAN